ncbi:MAG: tryptophan-rich sensory protein [Clostridia bacterium]|nr:tryptophan-rich sensory protein [Clostridia bacterium]
MIRTINLKKLALSVLLPLAVGFFAAVFSVNPQNVYTAISRPPLSPPPWVFIVVWSILYVLMGIAAYLIKDSKSPLKNKALNVYYISLALNFLWPIVFFNLQMYWLALVVLILLWVTVFIATAMYLTIDRTAAILMVPYLLWLSFAAYLNVAIACMN